MSLLQLLFSFNCFSSFPIENESIVQQHKELAIRIKQAYASLPEYFAKCNNLSTATMQVVYKKDSNILVSDHYNLQTREKLLISSSSYVQDLYDETHQDPEVSLSWPYLASGKLRDIDATDKKTEIYKKIFTNENNGLCAASLGLSIDKYNELINQPEQNQNPVHYLKKIINIKTLVI